MRKFRRKSVSKIDVLICIILFIFAVGVTQAIVERMGGTANLSASNSVLPVTFDDVPADYWAYDEIELIYSYGITVGCSYDPLLYCPDRSMTRAEAAVFAARLLELMGGEK